MSKREYLISFAGLKLGFHSFEYDITNAFFEGIEYSPILNGQVQVHLELEKKETMLIGKFHLEGTVTTACDRCTDDVNVEVEGDYQLIYKLGGEQTDNEDLVVLSADAYEIDVKENIYEFISISLPFRVIHEEGECNTEMMALLQQYVVNAEDEDDDLELEWDDEDFDDDEFDEDLDDDDDLEDESGDSDEGDDDDDKPIDPRWSILKNLN
jgi:uncharacterized protein